MTHREIWIAVAVGEDSEMDVGCAAADGPDDRFAAKVAKDDCGGFPTRVNICYVRALVPMPEPTVVEGVVEVPTPS